MVKKEGNSKIFFSQIEHCHSTRKVKFLKFLPRPSDLDSKLKKVLILSSKSELNKSNICLRFIVSETKWSQPKILQPAYFCSTEIKSGNICNQHTFAYVVSYFKLRNIFDLPKDEIGYPDSNWKKSFTLSETMWSQQTGRRPSDLVSFKELCISSGIASTSTVASRVTSLKPNLVDRMSQNQVTKKC